MGYGKNDKIVGDAGDFILFHGKLQRVFSRFLKEVVMLVNGSKFKVPEIGGDAGDEGEHWENPEIVGDVGDFILFQGKLMGVSSKCLK